VNALTVEPLAARPDATVRLPGSKSLTNRALVAAALARGTSRLEGALVADDTEAMVDGVRALGVDVEVDGDAMEVEGRGELDPGGPVIVHARLSGTTARFLLPVLALGEGPATLDGSAPLRSRPMGPLLDALRSLGAAVEGDALPVTVRGPLRGGTARLPGDVSSQFLSGLLLAGPHVPGGVRVELTTPLVSAPYVAMTASVMAAFGAEAKQEGEAWVVPEGRYRATTYAVEPDASAASYFFAAAVLTGGRVTVPGLGRGSLQGDLAFVDVLERMGAVVERGDDGTTVAAGAGLHGVDADLSELSDTAQTLAALAVFADSPTRVRGIGFARGKETDRLAAVVRELRRVGVDASETDDGFVVHPGSPRPAVVQTYDDHRMAMSFALLGLRVPGIAIAEPGCVAKTFPGFWDALEGLRRG
jgi:3-phosphoshikimate 1-carboxyvinyltransferase